MVEPAHRIAEASSSSFDEMLCAATVGEVAATSVGADRVLGGMV